MFFNADLIEECHSPSNNTGAVGWMDDVNIITWGSSTEENCKKLETIYKKCKKWEETHASKFNPTKFNLIHLPSKCSKITDNERPVWLDGREVKPVPRCRILGLIIDNKLNWNGHIEHIETKLTKSLGALSSLAGSTWGTGYKGLRQVYQATIIPQITYAASIWYAPLDSEDSHREKAVGKLEAIQKKAARIITGAFKTISGAALDIEAFLLPIRIHLNKITAEIYLWIRSTPSYKTLEQSWREGIWDGYLKSWHNLLSRWGPLERHKYRCETLLGPERVRNLE